MNTENYLTIVIITIALIIIGYILYNYYSYGTETTMVGYTFLSKDMVNSEPIFREQTDDSNQCIDRCIKDPMCHGITYDLDSNLCIGTNNGQIRKDSSHYIAWEKSEISLEKLFKTSLLAGYVTKNFVIPKIKIPQPSIYNECMFSFWINIADHYNNFEYWKHIFHKGDNPDNDVINYKDWNDLIISYENQYIGAWLAPFTNNMRIAVTTKKDKYKQIEFYDILNIPINQLFFVAVVIKGNYLEIYTNGKLFKIIKLDGIPQFNNSDLYIKNEKTFSGSLHNLTYIGLPTSHLEIANIYKEDPRMK
jgi:hypothetical protein